MQKPHAWKELPRTSAAGCHHRQPCPWVPHVVSSGPRLRPGWSLSVLARFYDITAWPIPGLGPRFVRDWNCVAFQFLQASQDQWQSLGCTWLYVVGIKQSLPTIGSIEGEADWAMWSLDFSRSSTNKCIVAWFVFLGSSGNNKQQKKHKTRHSITTMPTKRPTRKEGRKQQTFEHAKQDAICVLPCYLTASYHKQPKATWTHSLRSWHLLPCIFTSQLPPIICGQVVVIGKARRIQTVDMTVTHPSSWTVHGCPD